MGVVSCLGHEHDEFYNNLLAGKSGITEIQVRAGPALGGQATSAIADGCAFGQALLPPWALARMYKAASHIGQV